MLIETEWYEHHGANVAVRVSLKGQHRAFCLCHACKSFKPDTPENCVIAEKVYSLCKEENLVLPVWECPHFKDPYA